MNIDLVYLFIFTIIISMQKKNIFFTQQFTTILCLCVLYSFNTMFVLIKMINHDLNKYCEFQIAITFDAK